MKKLTLLVAAAFSAMSMFAGAVPDIPGTAHSWSASDLTAFTGTTVGNTGYTGGAGMNGISTDYTWITVKVVVSGQVASLRFCSNGENWFKDGKWVKKNGDAPTIGELNNASNLELWLDMKGQQKEVNPNDTWWHWGDNNPDFAAGTFTISSIVFYDYDISGGQVTYAWESQDKSVQLNKIDVNGFVFEDLEHPNPSYWYDTYANAWKEDYPAVNQNFTFAVEAKDEATKNFCDYTGATECTPTFGIHMWDFPTTNGDLRMQKINGYVYGFDMNASALKDASGTSFELGVCGADETLKEMWGDITIAFLGDEVAAGETAAWWTVHTGTVNFDFKAALPVADVMPAIDSEWANLVGCSLTAGVNAFGTTTGIADVIADEEGAEIIGFKSILGQDLNEEPAAGSFIVVLSNGKAITVTK